VPAGSVFADVNTMAGMALFHDPGWIRWPVALLATVGAGWMAFDGLRALAVGDYVRMGEDGLGPWADLVSSAGINPTGTGMKVFLAAYGLCWLAVVVAYLRSPPMGRPAMVIAAAASLWYLVIGTAVSLLILALLAPSSWARRRAVAGVRPRTRHGVPT
jgi:hypothetical protein